MSLKLILVLACVAVLFVALVTWGAVRDDEGSGWRFDTLAGWAAGRAVQSSDIADEKDCYSQGFFTVRPDSPCVVKIRPLAGGVFNWRHRQLRLALAAGLKVDVQLTPSEDEAPPVSVPLSLRVPEGPSLPVLPAGATLALTCRQPDITTGSCRVRLQRESSRRSSDARRSPDLTRSRA